MSIRKIARYAALITAMLAVLAITVNAPFAKAHPAQVTAVGTLEVRGLVIEPMELPIDTSFVSIVPDIIEPGTYEDVEFHGFCFVPGRHESAQKTALIKIDGLLIFEEVNFWVTFAVPKPTEPDFSEGKYSVNGRLSITISEITLPPPEITWALMKGKVTEYGENEAFGGLMVHARIGPIENHTEAHGAFKMLLPQAETSATEQLNCSFYGFRLTNAIKVELNDGETDLYIEGQWNVHNWTRTVVTADDHEVTVTMNDKLIAEDVYGELSATLEPPAFTLNIEGMDTISGDVVFYHFKFCRPNEKGIPNGDFNKDRRVNIIDLSQMAQAYKTRFGMPKYRFDLDVNSDFQINIVDLAATAQELGRDY